MREHKPIEDFAKSTTPIYMVNLVKYREHAQYRDSDPQEFKDLPKISGRECMYTRYLSGCSTVPVETPKLFASATCGNTGDPGTDREWDEVAIMEFRNVQHFREFIGHEEYMKNARPHRYAAQERQLRLASFVEFDSRVHNEEYLRV